MVIPLITSLISNPNTPFEQNRLLPCSLFCFKAGFFERNEIVFKVTDEIKYLPSPGRFFDMYFEDKNLAIFDIETTGLSPQGSKLILSGIITASRGQARFTQLLAENLFEERLVIEETLSILNDADVIVTYNGRSFDMPFLTKRAEACGISVPERFNLDVYLLLRSYSSLGDMLPGLRQKDSEAFLGISRERTDDISGFESVKLFEKYMNTGSFALRDKLLLHNADDIRQLYKLLPIIRSTDIHRAMFCSGFPVEGGFVKGCRLSGRALTVNGILDKSRDYISFPTLETPYSVNAVKKNRSVEVVFPCEKKRNLTYLDSRLILKDAARPLETYPGFEMGYLICSNGDNKYYMEMNLFIKEFFRENLSRVLG